jgi:hypothetical protein
MNHFAPFSRTTLKIQQPILFPFLSIPSSRLVNYTRSSFRLYSADPRNEKPIYKISARGKAIRVQTVALVMSIRSFPYCFLHSKGVAFKGGYFDYCLLLRLSWQLFMVLNGA